MYVVFLKLILIVSEEKGGFFFKFRPIQKAEISTETCLDNELNKIKYIVHENGFLSRHINKFIHDLKFKVHKRKFISLINLNFVILSIYQICMRYQVMH